MDMLLVHCGHQALDLTTDLTRSVGDTLQSKGLKPAIELSYGTVVTRFAFENETHCYLQAQPQSDHSAEPTGRSAPPAELSAVITLDDLRYPQVVPGMDRQLQHRLAMTMSHKLHVNGLVKYLFTNQKVIVSFVAFQGTRSHKIHLMNLIALLGLRAWILGAGDPWGELQRRTGQPRTIHNPFNRA